MNRGASVGQVPAVVVELHPGSHARVYCDGGADELPVLVLSDGSVEVLLSPPDTPTRADVLFAQRLATAVAEYAAAVRVSAGG